MWQLFLKWLRKDDIVNGIHYDSLWLFGYDGPVTLVELQKEAYRNCLQLYRTLGFTDPDNDLQAYYEVMIDYFIQIYHIDKLVHTTPKVIFAGELNQYFESLIASYRRMQAVRLIYQYKHPNVPPELELAWKAVCNAVDVVDKYHQQNYMFALWLRKQATVTRLMRHHSEAVS